MSNEQEEKTFTFAQAVAIIAAVVLVLGVMAGAVIKVCYGG